MTYLPVSSSGPPLVDYLITTKSDMDDLVTATVLTKVAIGGGSYCYYFPTDKSFGINGLIDLGIDQVGFLASANQNCSMVSMSPGERGFTSAYAGPTMRIAGATDADPATYGRIYLNGLLITNSDANGYALLTGGAGTDPIQRITLVGCTLRQGDAVQWKVVRCYGGHVAFLGCDFSKVNGLQGLNCFIDCADVSNAYGIISFSGCSFHGRAPTLDSTINTTAVLATVGTNIVNPVTHYSFTNCFFTHCTYIAMGSSNNLPAVSLNGCAVGRVTQLTFLASGSPKSMPRIVVRNLQANVMNGGATLLGGLRPLIVDMERCWNLSLPAIYDGVYGTNNIPIFTPSGTNNNYGDLAFRSATFPRFNVAAGTTFTGFIQDGGGPILKVLFNTGAQSFTLVNNSGLSDPANKILCVTGGDIVVPGVYGIAYIYYDYITGCWRAWT